MDLVASSARESCYGSWQPWLLEVFIQKLEATLDERDLPGGTCLVGTCLVASSITTENRTMTTYGSWKRERQPP